MSDASNPRRGYRHPFLIGTEFLGGVGDLPRTLIELAMCRLSYWLRTKPEWWIGVFDGTLRDVWAEEVMDRIWRVPTSSPTSPVEVQLSPRQIEYTLSELQGYYRLRDEVSGCQVSCFDRIWETDRLLDSELISRLNSQLQPRSRGHRAGSLYRCLIDPSLCPLRYTATFSADTEHPVQVPIKSSMHILDRRFAYLPVDVEISSTGQATFISYINNVHPSNHELYTSLETILSAFVPLFERTLTDLHRNNLLNLRISDPCKYVTWEEPEPPDFSDDEEGWANYQREMSTWVMSRPLALPDVPASGYPGGLEDRKHIVSLKHKRIQVIVKCSEINLGTDDSPHTGRNWRVEGLMNENIVACGLLITSMENIKGQNIEFRMSVTSPRGFVAGDNGATLRTWGLRDGSPCHQYIGSVPLRQGLAIVFPNIYQYRLSSVRLEDPNMSGHQRLLYFFLVDPDIPPILSTSVVPPQQEAWIRELLHECLKGMLPSELIERVMDFAEGLMNEEEAENVRRLMIQSRHELQMAMTNNHFCIPFDIWNSPDMLPQ